ncbi:MAG: hypothetical protein PHX89_01570 [bacterium]|nr:hypothetical protein [bacterium]
MKYIADIEHLSQREKKEIERQRCPLPDPKYLLNCGSLQYRFHYRF